MLCRSLSNNKRNRSAFFLRRIKRQNKKNIMSSWSCEKCGKNVYWCKPCQIDKLKGNFTNWTSGNEKIDVCIQEMQLKIDRFDDIVFEWIPYNQFSDIKEIGRGDFATVFSTIWKEGPLEYGEDNEEYTRKPNYKVALKCLHNSQNITNEVLNLYSLNFNFK